jgi:hypothetical protein
MIKQTLDNNIFLEIIDKLKKVKNCKLSANTLYAYMLSKDTFTYISYDNEIMNGCLVLKRFIDNEGNLSLLMLFIWLDARYPKLLKDFIELGNNKAKELKAKKIYFIADRNEKAIERRTGFKKAYTTYMKDVI